ncbi:hypothetical protein H4219_004476 [Mycoemilia scoparia]|uniref:RING-type E3 ubiquitin transferase n=1 Tax=Mycoemilia scoparia TaxID=417184 RepID=A0A9W8DRB3_9FUNG|nr:hypothetical protein H4219_004476 [Mycoemilia scoparia]
MRINVKEADKTICQLNVEHLTKIKGVRNQIDKELRNKGREFSRLLLLYAGKQLVDDHTIFDYDIKAGYTIVVMAVGAPPPMPSSPARADSPDIKVKEENFALVPEAAPVTNGADASGDAEKPSEEQEITDPVLLEIQRTNTRLEEAAINNCKKCQKDPNRSCKTCGCKVCGGKDEEDKTLVCEECNGYYHMACLNPPLTKVPEDAWFCELCYNDPNEIVQAGQKLDLSKGRKAKLPSAKQTRKWGGGMACAGTTKSCNIVPKNHIGPIPGVPVGSSWRYRIHLSESGVHRPPVAGIAGTSKSPAVSIVLAAGYPEDVDNGEEFIYTGSGGYDLSGNKRTAKEQTSDQQLTRMNLSLALTCNARVSATHGAEAKNWENSSPVRVCRSYKLVKHNPKYAPVEGVRYDGCYKLVKYWPEKGKTGFIVWRYLFRRSDDEPAPWTEEGKAIIAELGLTMYDPDAGTNGSVAETKVVGSKRGRDQNDDPSVFIEEAAKENDRPSVVIPRIYVPSDEVIEMICQDKANYRAWASVLSKKAPNLQEFLRILSEEEFMCSVCQDLVDKPVTTECGHNACLACMKKLIKHYGPNCPVCRSNISSIVQKDDSGQDIMSVNMILSAIIKTLIPTFVIDTASLPGLAGVPQMAKKSKKA